MKRRILASVILLSLTLPVRAAACPVCFGDPASAEVEGAQWAILFLIAVTGTVLTGVVLFALRVRRRARMTLDGSVQMPSPN